MKTEAEPQEEKKYAANMEENLPNDIFTQASKAMMDALIFGTFDDFENLLDDKVEVVLYQRKTIKGKADVMSYWWGWRTRFVMTKKVTNFEVVMSRYYSHACLKIETDQLVMFQMEEGKICKMLSMPMHLTSLYSDDNMLNYPLEYERIKPFLLGLEENTDEEGKPMSLADRIPCLHCGVESQDLNWFAIRRPDWFYKNWKFGVVSVCPNCGRVVEYKEVKTEESDDEKNVPIEGSKYSDMGNDLSDWANRIIPEDMDEGVNADNVEDYVSRLMNEMTEVRVEQGYKLEMRLPVEAGSGDRTHILVVDDKGNETEEIAKHLEIPPTEMGVWQLYLLERLHTVLPLWWHGGYNRRKLILKESDIDDIIPLKFHDLHELKEQEKLMPCVTIGSNDDKGQLLVVSCSYWNDWEGLVRQSVEYKLKNGRVVSENDSREVLYQFHCGLWY
ncbi:MAG: hypothetical protein IJ622_01770 [Bacteroidales bacterium]|nr:hypothetical protein [Bacteroidales bacterium]